jgi:hypothetical protein
MELKMSGGKEFNSERLFNDDKIGMAESAGALIGNLSTKLGDVCRNDASSSLMPSIPDEITCVRC